MKGSAKVPSLLHSAAAAAHALPVLARLLLPTRDVVDTIRGRSECRTHAGAAVLTNNTLRLWLGSCQCNTCAWRRRVKRGPCAADCCGCLECASTAVKRERARNTGGKLCATQRDTPSIARHSYPMCVCGFQGNTTPTARVLCACCAPLVRSRELAICLLKLALPPARKRAAGIDMALGTCLRVRTGRGHLGRQGVRRWAGEGECAEVKKACNILSLCPLPVICIHAFRALDGCNTRSFQQIWPRNAPSGAW
ncbi:hypothetical protein C8R47DRAFT_129354 [Mycena vitilis]|nr:hypothetical protein C8R47DRAFT_129354 [Mycena vitilis]